MPPEGYYEKRNKRQEEIINSFLSEYAKQAAARLKTKIYKEIKRAESQTNWATN